MTQSHWHRVPGCSVHRIGWRRVRQRVGSPVGMQKGSHVYGPSLSKQDDWKGRSAPSQAQHILRNISSFILPCFRLAFTPGATSLVWLLRTSFKLKSSTVPKVLEFCHHPSTQKATLARVQTGHTTFHQTIVVAHPLVESACHQTPPPNLYSRLGMVGSRTSEA